MPNRITSPKTRPDFGLVAWLESTRITLPLKGVEARFAVCGDVLDVEIDQVFQQTSARPLDCLYSFPLPAAAAVYRCEMHLKDRVISARVEEVQRARELVQEQKAAGRRTALVQMERDNLFTLELGNVQPEDLIVIRFAYFQMLTRLNDWTSFTIPFCPGVRYIPGTPLLRKPTGRGIEDDTDQVPDASCISPPRIDRLHPDAAYLALDGVIEYASGEVREVTSPTHPVRVEDGSAAVKVGLADQGIVPDSDFVLRWTELPEKELHPVGWVVRHGQESYSLARLQAPANVAASVDYAQDIYFLLDRSGSMQGLKWEKTVQAFREFVRGLGPKDRVWLTLFSSGFSDLAEKPLPPLTVLQDPAVEGLERLGAAGGTELLPALKHVLEKIGQHSSDLPTALVLVTDGQVGNERPILEQLRQYPALRVHTFGIDLTINDGFLQKMAAQHRGTSHLVAPNDDIVGAVARLGQRLRRPVLTNIRPAAGWEAPERELPDLHGEEFLSVPLKGPAAAEELALEGKLAGNQVRQFSFKLLESRLPALRLLWAKRRIEHHLAQGERETALDLAKRNNLICEGAAFVAWDEAEKVRVSEPGSEVYQPAMMPATALGSPAVGARLDDRVGAILQDKTAASVSAGNRKLKRHFQNWLRPRSAGPDQERLAALDQWGRAPETFVAGADELLALIREWVSADKTQLTVRLRETEELRTQLERCGPKRAARLAVISRWIESAWKDQPSFLDRARKLLLQVDPTLARPTPI
jgi:Ca-activated chloride channel family protein